jgi:hypothetical protein
MGNLDQAGEFLRISEHYHRMTDGELVVLARQTSELTPVAQAALANEVSQRRLKVQPEEPPIRPTPQAQRDPAEPDPYIEDRQLVEICMVWSLSDAIQVQTLLDRAGIPIFMGPERATGVDAVTSNFAGGVGVQIMQIGLPWAREAMKYYEPANEPDANVKEAPDEAPVRCPKCHSTDVIFEDVIPRAISATDKSPQKYRWICDTCHHEWEDDGIMKES